MRKILIKRIEVRSLEKHLRELLAMDRLYTIDDLVNLTGYNKQYIRSKLSSLQNNRYTKFPLVLKWLRCADNVKRVGNITAEQICDTGA